MADAAAAAPASPQAGVHLTPPAGLSSAEVAGRRSSGLANTGTERTSRSVAEILRANILPRFNFILGAAGGAAQDPGGSRSCPAAAGQDLSSGLGPMGCSF